MCTAKKKSLFIALLTTALLSQDIYAISMRTACLISGAVGTVHGVISMVENSGRAAMVGTGRGRHVNPSFLEFAVPATISGAMLGGLTLAVLFPFTPKGRLLRAKRRVIKLEKNSVATTAANGTEQILNLVKNEYTCDFYLAAAYNDLQDLLKSANAAIDLVESACKDTKNEKFLHEANEFLSSTRQAKQRIINAIKVVREHPDYKTHWGCHNKRGWSIANLPFVVPPMVGQV